MKKLQKKIEKTLPKHKHNYLHIDNFSDRKKCEICGKRIN